jgi:hypothetical protein
MNELSKRPKPPPIRLKNRGGAPKSNQNALKTGRHTAEMRALRAHVWRVISGTRRALATTGEN